MGSSRREITTSPKPETYINSAKGSHQSTAIPGATSRHPWKKKHTETNGEPDGSMATKRKDNIWHQRSRRARVNRLGKHERGDADRPKKKDNNNKHLRSGG